MLGSDTHGIWIRSFWSFDLIYTSIFHGLVYRKLMFRKYYITSYKKSIIFREKIFRHKVVRSSNQSELISIVWFAGFHLLLYLLLVFFYYLLLVWKTMVAMVMVMVMIRTVMKTRRTMTSHFTHSPTYRVRNEIVLVPIISEALCIPT